MFVKHNGVKKKTNDEPVDILIVREYPSLSSKYSSGLSADRKIEFVTELILENALISKVPHPMVLAELKKQKTQPQELIEKGFVHPSHYSWKDTVLFV